MKELNWMEVEIEWIERKNNKVSLEIAFKNMLILNGCHKNKK